MKEQLASLPEKCSFTTARPFDKLRNFRSRIVDKANKAQ
jgi:hypothetical protein